MSTTIRKAVSEDIPAILQLMREFAEYENLLNSFEVNDQRLRSAMFDDGAFVEGLIAENADGVIGYAIFYPYFATFRGQRGLYLEDIYVSRAHRGSGVGAAMLREVARIARSRGFERLDFQVLEWNRPAIAFYQKFGAVRDDEERHFKFTDQAFRDLAG
jgi:GNAT superfamily N-acetyltransferase